MTKVCKDCDIEKPLLANFKPNVSSRHASAYLPRCNDCLKIYLLGQSRRHSERQKLSGEIIKKGNQL